MADRSFRTRGSQGDGLFERCLVWVIAKLLYIFVGLPLLAFIIMSFWFSFCIGIICAVPLIGKYGIKAAVEFLIALIVGRFKQPRRPTDAMSLAYDHSRRFQQLPGHDRVRSPAATPMQPRSRRASGSSLQHVDSVSSVNSIEHRDFAGSNGSLDDDEGIWMSNDNNSNDRGFQLYPPFQPLPGVSPMVAALTAAAHSRRASRAGSFSESMVSSPLTIKIPNKVDQQVRDGGVLTATRSTTAADATSDDYFALPISHPAEENDISATPTPRRHSVIYRRGNISTTSLGSVPEQRNTEEAAVSNHVS